MDKVPVRDQARYDKVQKQNYQIWKFIDDHKDILYEFDKVSGQQGKLDLPSQFVEFLEPIEAVEVFKKVYWGLRPVKSANRYKVPTSYGFKHTVEEGYQLPKFESKEWNYHDWDNPYARSEKFYVPNGAFKGAMLLNGYLPKNVKDINWSFNVSRTSPLYEDPLVNGKEGRIDRYVELVDKLIDIKRKLRIKEQQVNNKN